MNRDADGNVVREEGFSQVVIWLGCIVGENKVEEFVKFFKEELGTRIQYLEELKTTPDLDASGEPVSGTGGRNDVFFAVHTDDIGSFAIKRFALGDPPRWIEDVYGNGHGDLYPERAAKYKTWDADSDIKAAKAALRGDDGDIDD